MSADKRAVGTRVRFVRDVERYPHFRVGAGQCGTVIESSEQQIDVQLDDYIANAALWENCCCWYGSPLEDDTLADYDGDVEVVEGDTVTDTMTEMECRLVVAALEMVSVDDDPLCASRDAVLGRLRARVREMEIAAKWR